MIKLKKAQLKIQEALLDRIIDMKKPLGKKAQLKIQEMAFMLVAVILFFGIIALFAMMIMYSSLKETSTEIKETRTLTAMTNLADSPELSCVASKSNCVDGDKLISLVGKKSYENFWSFSSLKVVKMNSFDKNEKEMIKCTKANYPDCDIFVVYDKKVKEERALSSFVALCRKEYENGYTYDRCEVAKLVAGTSLSPPGSYTEMSNQSIEYDTNPYTEREVINPGNGPTIREINASGDEEIKIDGEKICDGISDADLRNVCYNAVTSSKATKNTTKGLSICDFISNVNARQTCYFATRTTNENIDNEGSQRTTKMCEEINDSTTRNLCYKYIYAKMS